MGIGFGWSKGNLFYQNIISNSTYGISFWYNNLNVIYKNVFTGNYLGIDLKFSRRNMILSNNFIDNQQDVYFFINRLIQRNSYIGNYWNGSLSKPHIIHGGLLALYRSFDNPINWLQMDLSPAQEPYEIPTS